MTALNTYRRWLARVEDDALRAELSALDEVRDAAQIEDRFYRDLAFGTGGLRGVLGAGTNRMNVYVVRRATQGLAAYLKAAGLPLRCAIAYDSRIGSARFARETARVLAANGVTAYFYPRLEPTPALSWAVRYYGCGAGVCVTASHNPAAYNGYKVYGPDGCQITLETADAVSKHIGAADHFDGVRLCGFADALADGTIRMIGEDCLEAFLDAVERRSVWDGDRSALRVVYTPLNGTGRECVTKILRRIGVTDVTLVPEQAWPDGSFPTCPYPNPEERAALEHGLALARETRADLLLGTDPDCDRMGAAVPDGGDYRLLTGNEMGVLLLDYICRTRAERDENLAEKVAVTTIVSSAMVDALAAKYGFELRRCLTGFKYIGDIITELADEGHADRFIFGFEESYGYLSGDHVRDKDAVNASLLICQMAQSYKLQGKNLADAMRDLYAEHGYWLNRTVSVSYPGAEGAAAMAAIMERLRAEAPSEVAGLAVESVVDYKDAGTGLPPANVVEFRLAGGNKAIVRPSGTEPKIKLYVFAKDDTREGAEALLDSIETAGRKLLA